MIELPGWECQACRCFNGEAVKKSRICRACGTGQPWDERICTDCGGAPVHRDSWGNYCRRCGDKNNGGPMAYQAKVDRDKVRALLGERLAEMLFAECEVSI